MDQHNFLLKRMNLVGGPDSGYSGLESSVDYDNKALGDNPGKFYEWNGAKHMSFPVLSFDQDHVPLGDSVGMCLGLSWVPIGKRNQFDKYLNIRNMPECDEAKNGRSQWEPDYPTHGIDFNIWKQETKKGDSGCSGGIYNSAADTCYRYKVMTQVCVMTKFKHDTERNTYSWLYTGGCFKGNDPVNYEDVKPGDQKNFKDVQFEVRLDHRSFEEITMLPGLDDEDDDGANSTNSLTPEGTPPKKESDAERKIRLKKEEWEKKSEGLQDNSKGMYLFYQFFMFISGLSLFLAIICVFFLIFCVL